MASNEDKILEDQPIQHVLKSGLYIVATPIGNLGDITTRALQAIKSADLIACEDTRVTGKLLSAFAIKKPLMSYHEHNSDHVGPKILQALADGQLVVLVSDAVTPLISDPGYKLVRAAQQQDHYVTTCPGPSALITALTLAGLPTDRFTFAGFPPNKTTARQSFYQEFCLHSSTLVFYESARRLTDSLSDALAVFGNRQTAVCRELTKKFEQVKRGSLDDLINYYQNHGNPKGEVVLVIEKAEQRATVSAETDINHDVLLSKALAYLSVKDASAFVADLTGQKKKAVYQQALALKNTT